MSVIRFRLKERVSRARAMDWLLRCGPGFPEAASLRDGIGEEIFHGWRFIRALDGIVYFANCIEPGILESEILARRNAA